MEQSRKEEKIQNQQGQMLLLTLQFVRFYICILGSSSPVFLSGKSHGWRSLAGIVHGVTKGQTRLSNFTFTFCSICGV